MCDNSVDGIAAPQCNCPFESQVSVMQMYPSAFYSSEKDEENTARKSEFDQDQWISHYADDIFRTLLSCEENRQSINFRSQQIEHRPALLRLLRLAVEKHKLSHTTLHLAVYLIDRLMDKFSIRLDRLNLVAITCIIIAAKIEEADINVPKFVELNRLVASEYVVTQFKIMERKMLFALEFELIRPTVATFADFFSKGFITLDDYHLYRQNRLNGQLYYENYEEMASHFSQELFKMSDLSLDYLRFANSRPSVVAAACISAVRRLRKITPDWTPYLSELTGYTEVVIESYVDALLALYKMHHKSAKTNTLCESPDSGFISNCDTNSDTSENESKEDTEEESYCCLDYPPLVKRRKLN